VSLRLAHSSRRVAAQRLPQHASSQSQSAITGSCRLSSTERRISSSVATAGASLRDGDGDGRRGSLTEAGAATQIHHKILAI
jgi:hypothetical protein